MEDIKYTPKQWVLVREGDGDEWSLAQYSHFSSGSKSYTTVGGVDWRYCIPYEGNEALLGTTNQQTESFDPQDGDFVTTRRTKSVFICRSERPIYRDGIIRLRAYACYSRSKQTLYGENTCWNTSMHTCRPSTEEEKKLLLSKLHEDGKEWNAEKKEIVPLRKIPKEYTNYWTIDFRFDQAVVVESTWTDSKYDLTKLDHNLVFENEATAQVRAQEINTLIHKQIETIW